MKKCVRLIERMRGELGLSIAPGSTIERTRAKYHRLAAGGWSWFLVDPSGNKTIYGSTETVTELVRAKKLTTYKAMKHWPDTEIVSADHITPPATESRDDE